MEVKKFKKIEKKIFEVGFNEFYQAGSPNMFSPLNIVASSKALNKQKTPVRDTNTFSYN